jgi:hypothetical protein
MTEQTPAATNLTMGDVTQHIHQHAPEPRDLDYRTHALSFALTHSSHTGFNAEGEVLRTAAAFENYLRNGEPQEGSK